AARCEPALAPARADRSLVLSLSPAPRTSRPPTPPPSRLPKRAFLPPSSLERPHFRRHLAGRGCRFAGARTGRRSAHVPGQPGNGRFLHGRQPAANPTGIRVRPSPPRRPLALSAAWSLAREGAFAAALRNSSGKVDGDDRIASVTWRRA